MAGASSRRPRSHQPLTITRALGLKMSDESTGVVGAPRHSQPAHARRPAVGGLAPRTASVFARTRGFIAARLRCGVRECLGPARNVHSRTAALPPLGRARTTPDNRPGTLPRRVAGKAPNEFGRGGFRLPRRGEPCTRARSMGQTHPKGDGRRPHGAWRRDHSHRTCRLAC